MPQVFLSLGSNVDREKNIHAALDALASEFGYLRLSSVYQTKAQGFEGEDFYNLVVALNTDLKPSEINAVLKKIESMQGRSESEKGFAARKIDIDLVTYGNEFGRVDGVELPRSEIHKYSFVLYPMVEVAGEQVCPGLEKTYYQLWYEKDFAKESMIAVDFEWDNHFFVSAV